MCISSKTQGVILIIRGRALVVACFETGGPGLPDDGPGLFGLLVLEGGLFFAGHALQVFLVRAPAVVFELLPGLGTLGLEVVEVVQVVRGDVGTATCP